MWADQGKLLGQSEYQDGCVGGQPKHDHISSGISLYYQNSFHRELLVLAPLQPSPKLWLWWLCGEKAEFYPHSSWQGSLSHGEEIYAGERTELLKVFPTNCHDFDSAGIKLAPIASFSEQPHRGETEEIEELPVGAAWWQLG